MRAIIAIAVLLFWGMIAPLLATHDPRSTDPGATLQPPSAQHWLGTDAAGRDVWSRTVIGGQRSLLIASAAASIAIMGGLLLAIIASMVPQRLVPILNVLLNASLALPPLILALVILTLLGRGSAAIVLATGLAQLPFFARVALTSLLEILPRDYVLAARAAGARREHIVIRHLLIGARSTLLSYATVIFSYCLINSAALGLLGLSGDPSLPEWGIMLTEGRAVFRTSVWPLLAPALALSMTVIAVNALADRWH